MLVKDPGNLSLSSYLTYQSLRLFSWMWRPEVSISRLRLYRRLLWERELKAPSNYPGYVFETNKIGHIPVEFVHYGEQIPKHTIFFLHGGGYAFGSIASYRKFSMQLARSTGCRVLQLDYRLAPEHPFPAALEDAFEVYCWLLESSSAKEIFIGGDSSGGGLALSLMKTVSNASLPLPKACVLLSPWANLHRDMCDKALGRDLLLCNGQLRRFAALYAPDRDLSDPLISPVNLDFRGLCPLYIQVGSDELLLEDAERVACRAQAVGIPTKLDIWPKMQHCWQLGFPYLPESKHACERLADFVRSHCE